MMMLMTMNQSDGMGMAMYPATQCALGGYASTLRGRRVDEGENTRQGVAPYGANF